MKATILLLCLSVLCLCEAYGPDRVKLHDATTVTLHAGQMTKGRSDPVPQIKCVGWCPISEPRTASCVKRGFDGNNIQWECKADLEDGFEFDNVDVLCGGHDYINDPNILQGLCGLKYTLRASPETKKTPYTYSDTPEKSSLIKDLIRALNKTCISSAVNYTRTDRSSSNNDTPDVDTSEPRMGWNIVGFGSLDSGGCTGCTSCVNCPNCSGCTNCRDCTNCSGCSGCSGCVKSSGCISCVNCTNSFGCTNSRGCTGCMGSPGCSGCVNCSGCTSCVNCTNCTGCTNCRNCHGCNGCSGQYCN